MRHGAKVHVPVSRDQHLTWIRMFCQGYCSTDQSSSAYTLELTYQITIHVVNLCNSLAEEKACYDCFAQHKYNLITYIMPHIVVESRYTNVKNHSEISRYFLVHVLPYPLWNSKELAKFYHWCAILIAHQIVMAKNGGSCVNFSGISTCGRTPRETVSHPQSPPLPTLYKYLYPSTLLWQINSCNL